MRYTREDVEKQERRQLYVAVAFFALALLLANLPGSVQQQMATVLRGTVLRPFVTMQRVVTRTRLRAVETSILRARFDSLTTEMVNNAALADENARLRSLLDLGGRLGTAFRAASVIRSGTPGSESVFMLDLGRREDVRANAPVVVREGLVGKVIEVRTHESIAMDWSHPEFRASAMSADGQAYGLVEPDRGIFRESDRLLLNGIPFYTELEPGTLIVTSGRGGVFPRGIPIGTVVELAEAEERWRRSYWLRPSARPADALHVLVSVGSASGEDQDMAPAFDTLPADSAAGVLPTSGPDLESGGTSAPDSAASGGAASTPARSP